MFSSSLATSQSLLLALIGELVLLFNPFITDEYPLHSGKILAEGLVNYSQNPSLHWLTGVYLFALYDFYESYQQVDKSDS